MAKLISIVNFSILLFGSTLARAAAVTTSLDYEGFIQAIETSHPEGSIDKQNLNRDKKSAERSGYLSDPLLSVGRDYVPIGDKMDTRTGMDQKSQISAQWKFGLSQNFPWPGTLSAEKEIADLGVKFTQIQNDLSAFNRKLRSADLFLKMVRTHKLIEIEERNFQAVDGVRELSHEKFKQGLGSHYEYLQAHSESGVSKINLGSLKADLTNLEQHAQVLLNSLPNQVHSFIYEWPKVLIEPEVSERLQNIDFNQMKIDIDNQQSLARQNFAEKSTFPSFMASGEIMKDDDGMQMYGAMIGVSVPIFSLQKRHSFGEESSIINEQTSEIKLWQLRIRDLALSQTKRRLEQLRSNLTILDKEIIPPVKEHIEAATAQFSQGKIDIASLISARRILLNLEVSRIRALEALARTTLSVEKIQNGLFEEELDIETPQVVNTQASMKMEGSIDSSMSRFKKRENKNDGSLPKGNQKMNSNISEPASQSPSSGMGM